MLLREYANGMTDDEILSIYNILAEYHARYFADKGVTLPALKKKDKYIKDALVLVRLAKNYPDTDIVSKDDLTAFMKTFYESTVDVQQARHLAMQKGWYVTVYFLLFLCLFSHIAFPILTPHWQIVKNGQNSELFLRVFAVKLFTV